MISREILAEAVPEKAESVDVVIPVFNEEDILQQQLSVVMPLLPPTFRILVVENGSTDSTRYILEELENKWDMLDVLNMPEPNYGLAMKRGLVHSDSDVVITDDLDVMDVDFWIRGLRLLSRKGVDLVQGSKVLAGKNDCRPPVRKIATRALTFLLRWLLKYTGTDTHGPKVIWAEAIEGIPAQCVYELDIFPTELVVRAQRSGVRIEEIPIHLKEIRATPLPLSNRIPRALRDIWRLRNTLLEEKNGA